MVANNQPLKRFSQNFLTNPHFQKKIVDALELSNTDVVVEIGPGKGALTQHIVKKPVARFVAVEIDHRWAEALQDTYGSKIEVIQQDVLAFDFSSYFAAQKRIKVVGNLPYHITSPVLFYLLDNYGMFERAVLMVQKEVGRRICASPGSKAYGILSVVAQTYARVEYLFEIGRGNFFPVPKVDSAVIALKFFPLIKDVTDEKLFRTIVRGAFNFRRKTLKNSLSRILPAKALNLLDEQILKLRPEQLTVDQFKQLSNQIAGILNHEAN